MGVRFLYHVEMFNGVITNGIEIMEVDEKGLNYRHIMGSQKSSPIRMTAYHRKDVKGGNRRLGMFIGGVWLDLAELKDMLEEAKKNEKINSGRNEKRNENCTVQQPDSETGCDKDD